MVLKASVPVGKGSTLKPLYIDDNRRMSPGPLFGTRTLFMRTVETY